MTTLKTPYYTDTHTVSVYFSFGKGIIISGIPEKEEEPILRRVISALSAIGISLPRQTINIKITASDYFGHQKEMEKGFELLDFPIAVAIMNELGRLRYCLPEWTAGCQLYTDGALYGTDITLRSLLK